MRIGARIFAGAQKTLLSIKTQLMLPCWLSSTGWRLFLSAVTRALSQAVTARQGNAAAINSLFRVVVMIRVLVEAIHDGTTVLRQGRRSSGTLGPSGSVKFTS